MAELIPISYRLRAAQKRQVHRWIVAGVLAASVSAASLVSMFAWEQRQASEHRLAAVEYQKKSTAIAEAQRVIAARAELARKMETVQQLMDDRTLLALLQRICAGFSTSDSLEYINIDAQGPGKQESKDGPYAVRITGITANNATLADLITRLTRQSSGEMTVLLESSHREALYDGQVVRFELRCARATTKGS